MKYKRLVPFLMQASNVLPRRHSLRGPSSSLSCSPFFVFGSGRNGSTMFSAMLDAHPDIVLPTEQWRLPNVIIKYQLMNFLEWRDLVSIAVSEFTATEGAIKWNLQSGDLLTKLYHLPKEEQSLQRIIDEIYVAYGKQQKETFLMWGDKTPRNTFYLKDIYRVFPESKYIFLMRDGRDVVRSWIVRDKTDDIESRADAWNFSVDMYDWVQQRAADRLMMVRYEELVSDSEAILKKVADFLGLEYSEKMLDYHGFTQKLGDDIVEASNFQKVRVKPNTGSIGKWKKDLTPQQIEKLNKMMGKNLERFGFEMP